jgi:hypothetical protein
MGADPKAAVPAPDDDARSRRRASEWEVRPLGLALVVLDLDARLLLLVRRVHLGHDLLVEDVP